MLLKHQENLVNFPIHNQVTSHCLSGPSFWLPDLINTSAWLGHAPFAFWIVNASHPSTIVELGTHQGYSYFAFCQAVHQLGFSTRCYAIDIWQGDEHAGFYGEEVFQKVFAHNQKYSGFSQLLRSTFDDALDYFLDNSIDILHIDGRHFYDDVKHDFDAWLPKLSDRGVVLIHDINVKERQFGVFRLWEELRQLYPHFEFIHEHGLGVLGVGKSLPSQLIALFEASSTEQTAIRSIYSRLGNAVRDRYHLANQCEQTSQLMMETERLHSDLVILKEKLSQSEATSLKLEGEIEEQHKELLSLINQAQEWDEIKATMDIINRKILHLKNQLSITENALRKRENVIEQLGQTITQIHSSRSWRFTSPLRKLIKLFS